MPEDHVPSAGGQGLIWPLELFKDIMTESEGLGRILFIALFRNGQCRDQTLQTLIAASCAAGMPAVEILRAFPG